MKLPTDKYFKAVRQRIANNGDGVKALVESSLTKQFSESQCTALLQAVNNHPQLKDQAAIAESLSSRIHSADALLVMAKGPCKPDSVLAALEAAGAADDATLTRFAAFNKKNLHAVIRRYPYSERTALYQAWASGDSEMLKRIPAAERKNLEFQARWEVEKAQETALCNEINSTESVQRLFELWDQKLADDPRKFLHNRLRELAKGPNGAAICEEATRRIRIDPDMIYDGARKKYEKLQQIIYAGTEQDFMSTLLLAGGETLVNNSVKRLTGGRSEDSSVEGDVNFLRSVYRFHPEYRAMFAPIKGKPVRMHEDFAGWYCVPNDREARGDYEYVIDFEKV